MGDIEPDVSLKTLWSSGGILGVTSNTIRSCNDGTWILADTGATHEPVGLREGQKVSSGTRPCKLQLAIGQVDGWATADEIGYIVTDAELPKMFPD